MLKRNYPSDLDAADCLIAAGGFHYQTPSSRCGFKICERIL